MTEKHTPGPWKAYLPTDTDDRFIINNNGVLIADLFAATHYDLGVPERSELKANTHLIAAAPELLEALKEARLDLIDHTRDPWIANVIDDLTAAIAKAEGKQS